MCQKTPLTHRHNRKNVGVDPTRTIVLRKKFTVDFNKRFRALKKLITESIDDNDALALRVNQPLAPRQFDFRTLDEKHDLFMLWLQEQIDADILEVTQRSGLVITSRNPWMNVYLSSAYQKGILRARQEVRAAGGAIPQFGGVFGTTPPITPPGFGVGFNQPVHAGRAALVFTRAFTDLQGITQAMSQQISRVLAQGMVEGKSPKVIARELNDRVDKIGLTRARVLAQTEIIRAHHVGNIGEYRELGVLGVEIIAEFVTAGDSRVCIQCANLAGKRFTLDEAEGVIPVHPRCRCSMRPILDDQIEDQPPFQTPAQIKKIAGL